MKKLLALLLAASMIFGLAACGTTDTVVNETAPAENEAAEEAAPAEEAEAAEEAAPAEDGDKKVLRINLASEPDYLDPALNSSVDGGCLVVNSFAGLYTYDAEQNLIPDLATEMPEISEDGCTYVVKMRESKWSNGEELTANDFVYSWNRVIAPETAADYAYLFDLVARKDDGTLDVEATDDYTLTIQLVSPCPYFNDLLAFATFFPVYQPEVEAADPDKTNPGAWCQEAGFVSNGAYTCESWVHNESMVYVKNENYWDAANTTIDELDFMLSADDTAIYAAYNSGDVDFIDSVPNDEIQALLDNPEFHIIDNLGTYYAAFNVNADVFKDMENPADFRKAVSLLIDRQYIVDNIGQTGQQLADSYIPAGMADGNGGIFKTEDISYYDATLTGAGYVEDAIALFENCGYSFTDNGDGTYQIDPAVSIEYLTNDSSAHKAIAESIQQDLAIVGIDVSIAVEDWNVFLQDRKDGNYTFAREGWLADFNDPINMLEMFTTDSGNNDPQYGRNPENPNSPDWTEYDALIEEIRTTTDFAARVDAMHKAEDILMDTWGVIPIYYYNDVFMQKPNVNGIYSTIFGMKYFMHATID